MSREQEINEQIKRYENEIKILRNKINVLNDELKDSFLKKYDTLIGKTFRDAAGGKYFMILGSPRERYTMEGYIYNYNKLPAYILYANKDDAIDDYGTLITEEIYIWKIFEYESAYDAFKDQYIEIPPEEFYQKINEVAHEVTDKAMEESE